VTDIVYGIRITGEASGAKKAFEETAGAQKKLTGAERDNSRAAQEIERATERKSMALRRFGLVATAATVAVVAFGRSAVNAAIQAERAHNRLEAVVRATGGALGVTREDLGRLAESLAAATVFDDDDIRNAQAQLLKFGNIHGQVFKEALRLSADLASFMGTDVAQGAQMIGRSLQSPSEGLRLMEREFGKLTDAEEKHINTLVSQGRAVEAQNAVLALWQSKIGGTANLMNTGLTRATGDLSEAWGDLLKTLGKEGSIFNRSLGGATALIRDIEGELKGVRTPLSDLADDTLSWLAVLRFVPSAISLIGVAAHNAQMELDKQRRTVSGRIRNTGLEDAASLEASLANTPRVPITLGGDTAAAREREQMAKERAKERAEIAAGYAESLALQQEILDEAAALGVAFLQRQEALKKEGEAVRDAINPWNAYAREVERLRALLDRGLISQREFGDAVALEARKVGGAYEDMADKGTQSFDELKHAIEGWGLDLSRELARGEVSIRSFGRLFEELLAMQINARAVQPFLTQGTSFIDSLLNPEKGTYYDASVSYAAPFHTGGIAGLEGGARRYVNPGYFERAPRLHAGGLAGGEVPAILQRGEGVFTREQMRAMGGGAPIVKFEVNNQAAPVTARQQGAPRFDGKQWVVGVVLNALATDGGFRQQVGGYLKKPEH
jgi:hypothetical protein